MSCGRRRAGVRGSLMERISIYAWPAAREPQAVFDTMLAAQLLGLKAFGYGALVEKFCGITLTKTSQKADWSRRPLSQAMIDYAVQDTEYLEPVAETLGTQLDEK